MVHRVCRPPAEAQDGHRVQEVGAACVGGSGAHEGQPDTPGAPHGVLCELVRGRSASRFHLYGNGCAAEAAAEAEAEAAAKAEAEAQAAEASEAEAPAEA